MGLRGTLLVLAFVGAGALLWVKRADLEALLAGHERGGAGLVGERALDGGVAGGRSGSPDAGGGWDLPAPSGELVDIALIGTPAHGYGPGVAADGNDMEYRALLDEVARELGVKGVIYDSALSRAAREVAYQTGVAGRIPPEAAMGFLLHSSGAPEFSAAQYFTHSTGDDMDLVRATLVRALEGRTSVMGRGPLRVGVGEVATPGGEYTRHVGVLTGRREYDLDPVPRWAAPGGRWTLSGRLPTGYREPSASVLYPDNRMETFEVQARGRDFSVTIPVGQSAGTVYVSVDGADERGPGKLLQVTVEVCAGPDALPTSVRVFVPEIETDFASLEDAESYALALLLADRMSQGLAPLIPDPELATVARGHSEDMRDHGFFAHLSPRTGLAGDRLEAAGYRSTMHAENLARNDTLGEAEAALMASIGHRKNILDPTPTHVGVGLAERREGENRSWFVTQLFARKVVAIDAERAQAQLLARIAQARAERGVPPVDESPRMARVAADYAGAVARGELDGVAHRALAELRDMKLSMGATVHAIYDIESFVIPDDILAEDITGVGVGVRQSTDDSHGRIGVVLLFANGWDGDP